MMFGRRHGVLGLLVVILNFGCSYHGALRPLAQPEAQSPAAAAGAELTLSNQLDGISNYELAVDFVRFNYDVKQAYFNAAKSSLESIYGPVPTGSQMAPGSRLFAVPYFKANTLTAGNGTAKVETHSRIDVYEGAGGNLLRSYASTQQFTYNNPPSASALGLVTGLTLFALAPITLTSAVQIEGNHGRELLEQAIQDSLLGIRTQLAQDRKRDQELAQIDTCFRRLAAEPSLSAIASQVALADVKNQTFEMLANTKTPTDDERIAIKQWATLTAGCYAEQDAFLSRWNVPAPIKALLGETRTASQNLRVLLFGGGITYGEYAAKRKSIGDAFFSAQAKIETELAEQSAEAQARANSLAMQAQQTNLAEIQTRQMQTQTLLMGLQTINQTIQINQQNQQHRELMNQIQQPVRTNCQVNQYNVNCTSW
jgi:hypothetical protein